MRKANAIAVILQLIPDLLFREIERELLEFRK